MYLVDNRNQVKIKRGALQLAMVLRINPLNKYY